MFIYIYTYIFCLQIFASLRFIFIAFSHLYENYASWLPVSPFTLKALNIRYSLLLATGVHLAQTDIYIEVYAKQPAEILLYIIQTCRCSCSCCNTLSYMRIYNYVYIRAISALAYESSVIIFNTFFFLLNQIYNTYFTIIQPSIQTSSVLRDCIRALKLIFEEIYVCVHNFYV